MYLGSFLYIITGVSDELGSHTNNINSAFSANIDKINVAVKLENNGYTATVWFWHGHITWVHIHTMFEEDLLNIYQHLLAKQVLNKGMLHQD